MEVAGGQDPPPLELQGGVRTDYLKFIKVWYRGLSYEIGITDPLGFGFADLVTNVRARWSNLFLPEDTLTFLCEPNPGTPESIPIKNDLDLLLVMNLPQVMVDVHVFSTISNEGIRTRLLIQEAQIKRLQDTVVAGQQNPLARNAAELGAPPENQGPGQ